MAGRHRHRLEGVAWPLPKIRLLQGLAVNVDLPVADLDRLAGQADYALYKVPAWVVGKPENHDITPLGRLKQVNPARRDGQKVTDRPQELFDRRPIDGKVNKLGDQQILIVPQAGLHARALNLEVLDEAAHYQEDKQGKGDCLENFPGDSEKAGRLWIRRLRLLVHIDRGLAHRHHFEYTTGVPTAPDLSFSWRSLFGSLAGSARPNGVLSILGAVCGAPLFLVVAALLWGVFCESLIIAFSIHETLVEIRDTLRRSVQ
jgi:hypothetical protein